MKIKLYKLKFSMIRSIVLNLNNHWLFLLSNQKLKEHLKNQNLVNSEYVLKENQLREGNCIRSWIEEKIY